MRGLRLNVAAIATIDIQQDELLRAATDTSETIRTAATRQTPAVPRTLAIHAWMARGIGAAREHIASVPVPANWDRAPVLFGDA